MASSQRRSRRERRRGTIIVLSAFLLVIFTAVLALSIDTGMMCNSRDDMQRAVDSGALAAATELASNPANVDSTGRQYTKLNSVLQNHLPDANISVVTGYWNFDTRSFQTGATTKNAVRITAQQP